MNIDCRFILNYTLEAIEKAQFCLIAIESQFSAG